jgi:DNA repair protein RadC
MAEYGKLSIKQWAVEDRPREKLLSKGIMSLSDAELLAILIGSGTKEASAVDLAKEILRASGNNLNDLSRMNVHDLKKFRGIGEARAISIVAAMELGRRRKLEEVRKKKRIGTSRDVYDFFHPFIGDLSHEEFWVLHLSRSNRILAWKKISQGGIAGTVTDVRLILKDALENTASSLIICHNHPSGNLQPSEADKEITRKIAEAAKIMDIRLLDHLIIGEGGYFSFADENLL